MNGDETLILHQNLIVIPTTFLKREMMLAHESHQIIVNTNILLIEKVWFLKIEAKLKKIMDVKPIFK